MKVGDTLVLAVPVGPVRTAASDAAELCTQALAGESADVLERGEKDWIKVELHRDGYQGWVDAKQWHLPVASETTDFQLQSAVSAWTRSDGALLQLPAGSVLGCDVEGRWTLNGMELSPIEGVGPALAAFRDPVSAAQQFLGAPYMWGGKTVFGIDCSGLVQMAWGLMGQHVPRDASVQALEGVDVAFGDQRPGDLAFFKNAEGRVVHVGILLAPDCILHAAGEVRLDEFDASGILRDGTQTHVIHSIRRW